MALLVLLILDNVRWALIIDDTRPPAEQLHRSSRNLRKLAAIERNVAISGRLAAYYQLARTIGGATLVVPSQLAHLTWMLERVARLHVVVDPSALRVDGSRLERLRRSAKIRADWYVRGKVRASRVIGKLHIQPDPTADEYVLGTIPRDAELFVVPRAVYEANREGVGPVPP